MDLKKTFSLLSVAGSLFLSSQKLQAAGVENKEIWVDKTVKNPINQQWVENLDNSVAFNPNDPIEFKIRIKNNGDQILTNLKIIDTLPSFVLPIAGPGEYREETRQVVWSLPSLEPHQEAIFDVFVKVAPREQLPLRKTSCVENRIEARTETGDSSSDTARFCLGIPTPTTVTPETGIDPHLAIQGLACLSLMGLGLKLRRCR